jgi:hypothetical protein
MKLSDLDFYQSPWLSLPDLAGRAARVTISEVKVEEVRQRDGSKARKVVLSFSGKRKRLICNVSQARAAGDAWGDDLDRWVGKAAILQPGKAENGKDTILLIPVPPAAHEPPPAAQGGLQPAQPGDFRPVQPGDPLPPAAQPEPGERAPGVWPPMTDAEAAALWATEPA